MLYHTLTHLRYLRQKEEKLRERRRVAEETLRRQEELVRREQALQEEEREIDSLVSHALRGLQSG